MAARIFAKARRSHWCAACRVMPSTRAACSNVVRLACHRGLSFDVPIGSPGSNASLAYCRRRYSARAARFFSSVIMRNTPWLRDFWKRVYEQTDVIYHIWWENAGICKLMEQNLSDAARIQITHECRRFNAYLMGLPNAPLWEQGDLLVHFAGVYDSKKMASLIDEILEGKTPRLPMF
jgi:hypothetical protein